MNKLSTTIRQWCQQCNDFTRSVPCDKCGAPHFTCARCEWHPDHLMEEDY